MESEHHQRQCAPFSRLSQQNCSPGLQPDFSKPPPPFVPNCQVLPPQPPLHRLPSPDPKFSPWGSQHDNLRHSVPLLMSEYDSQVGGYFTGLNTGNVPESTLSNHGVLREECVKDKEWIEHFLRYQICSKSKDTVINSSVAPQLKIFEAKCCMEESQMVLKDLEALERDMMDRIESSNAEEWQNMCALVVTKKMQLEENLHKLSDPFVIKTLKKALIKRRKKRLAMKRRRTKQKEEKMASLKRHQQLHLSIDSWLEEMQQSAEKVKLEESLKQQADSVLSEVTRKKAEARRQLSLLSMLVKLRRIRVQATANRGEKTSMELVDIFENVIEKLQKYWSDQLKDYNLEEKGLRLMLEEATEDSSTVKKTLHQRIMSQWQKVLFGKNGSVDRSLTVADRDIEEFIKIRHEWDKFVVPSGVPMASSIPVGWIVPVKPCSGEWENLLEAANSKHLNK